MVPPKRRFVCVSVGCRGWSVGAAYWRVPECMCAEQNVHVRPQTCASICGCVSFCCEHIQYGDEGGRDRCHKTRRRKGDILNLVPSVFKAAV